MLAPILCDCRLCDEETEIPRAKPDLVVQCIGCMGAGVIRYVEISDRTCRGCFGTGVLSLPHQAEPTEDSAWDAAMELFSAFKIEKDPEAYAYRFTDGGFVVVSYETFQRGRAQ